MLHQLKECRRLVEKKTRTYGLGQTPYIVKVIRYWDAVKG